MKNTKKFLSVLLAVALLFTMITVVSAAEGDTVALTDIDPNTVVGKAVTKLISVGIINGYEDSTYRPDNTITRAEFAKVIATFLGLADFATDGIPTGFSDVDSTEHWGQKYIKLAVDKGIVLGYEDGTFRPDNPVKYSEAVKMLVCALGYGDVAAHRTAEGTPWYSGYIALAGDLKLLLNSSINSYENEASRGNVAIITYNALDVEVADTTTSTSGKTTTTGTGMTAQETYLKSKDMKGVVIGCYQTSLSGVDTNLKENFIIVKQGSAENKYKVPDGTDTFALLGYYIEASTDEEYSTSDYKFITGIQKTNKNEVTKINADDISSVQSGSIQYWASEKATKTSSISFSGSTPVIYNGRYYKTVAQAGTEIFNIKAGNLVFISNDGDSKADVAFVNDCEIFAVSSMATDSQTKLKKIYTLYGGGEILVPEKGTKISINNKGTKVERGDSFSVSKYDVINLYRSKDGEVFDMTVTRNKVTGSVSEKSSDDKITIKNTQYKIAYNLAEYTGTDAPVFTIGTTANVYTDMLGQIAAAEKTTALDGTANNIGYIIGVGDGDGIDGTAQIKLFGLAGKLLKTQKIPLASTVKIDGVKYSSTNDIKAKLKASAAEANKTKSEKSGTTAMKDINVSDYNQLVCYTLNSKNMIDTIDTVIQSEDDSNSDFVMSLEFPNSKDESYNINSWSGKYSYKSGNIFVDGSGKTVMGVGANTKVLVIPKDLSNTEKYRTTSYSYFTAGSAYRVEGYCFSSTKVASYVLVYTGTDSVSFGYNSDIAIADKVSQTSSADASETEDKLTGWNFKTGAEVTNLRSKDAGLLYGNVSSGEIFRYVLDGGKVDQIEMILEKDENGMPILFKDNKRLNALDAVDGSSDANTRREVNYDSRYSSDWTKSVCLLEFGTVVAKNDGGDNGSKTIIFTHSIDKDAGGHGLDYDEDGVAKFEEQLYSIDNDAKYFVIDFTQGNAEDIVSADSQFDEIRSVEELRNAYGDDYDRCEASQVLLFFKEGKIKTVVILKYNHRD